MLHRSRRRQALACALALACGTAYSAEFTHPDHYEFNAMLDVPFQSDGQRWPITLRFDYPGASDKTDVAWTVEVLDPAGQLVGTQSGITPISQHHVQVDGRWNGRNKGGQPQAPGYYTVRLRATPTVTIATDAGLAVDARVRQAFTVFPDEVIEQQIDVMVGQVPAARMPQMRPLRIGGKGGAASQKVVVSDSALPYTIYYGNMHSQTNHSDGGAPVASCGGSEVPQGGSLGPTDAYTMMQAQAGGDFLLTSEHNHIFDGSTGTKTTATPAFANNLFHSGLQAAADYRAAHPDFMALYGLEWGVISNGGHLNLINVDALTEWEYNSSSQLIGEVFTAKSDYPALYATMQQRGWIGQFNHPASSGQFLVGGTALGYDANGAQVMVLAEVLNSSAFSINTTQTETGRSSYTGAWNKLLESGYHVAPSSDQDNHCANWGLSFTNRTGVLLPTASALTTTDFYAALRARRAFATEDKAGQLVLTANSHVMGESFANSGALTLAANYASTNGQTAQRIQFFEGVPRRNGTVTQLTEGSGTYTFTPAAGEHFYYALVTQANGLRLWSAPIWVSQGGTPPTDTTPPSVSAGEAGTSGTITLSATASDNVGVTNVEFYIDGVLMGSDATSPYALALDSTTLANGTHTLTAKAFDAAGNSANSTAVSFTVSNVVADTTPPSVTAGETGTSGTITLSATASDNVGVTNVEFYVDGVLKGSDATSPYALALDSTTLVNGAHSLIAKAFDAAGNSASSTAISFTVSNVVADTTPPTVSASEAGNSGTITLSATASDNVGVSRVEFYVDGTLKGTDTASPYTMSLDSTTLSNASHNLTAKAFDAAGNSATTPPVSFTISNATTAVERILNGGYESGATSWTASSGVISSSTTYAAHGGTWKAWMNGYGATHTDSVYQTVAIPATAASATLSFWVRVVSDETTTTTAYDTLKVQLRNTSNTVLTTLATYSNLNKGSTYVLKTFDVSAYKGQTVRVYFEGVEGTQVATSFLIDDVSLKTQ